MRPESLEQVDVEAQGHGSGQKATRCEQGSKCRRLEWWMWVVSGKGVELCLARDLKVEGVP